MLESKGSLWDSAPMLRKCLSYAGLILYHLNLDSAHFFCNLLKSRLALAAEYLFLRKQLILYLERQVPPKRAKDATRLTLVLLGRLLEWKEALKVIRPETFVVWQRRSFKLFWRRKFLN